MTKIICITGIDGAGKNTLIDLLAKKLESFVIADIWDSFNNKIAKKIFNSKTEIDKYLCNLTPDSRLFFLSHALKYSIERALKSKTDYILVNAYYYKYFASEISLGANSTIVKKLIDFFPNPDFVFKLEIAVEIAAKRKQKLSKYECGVVKSANTNNFIQFQKLVKKEWGQFQNDNMIILDATKKPEHLLNEVMKIINHI